jgi:hypothetical protein
MAVPRSMRHPNLERATRALARTTRRRPGGSLSTPAPPGGLQAFEERLPGLLQIADEDQLVCLQAIHNLSVWLQGRLMPAAPDASHLALLCQPRWNNMATPPR